MNLCRWGYKNDKISFSCGPTTVIILLALMATWTLFMLVPSAVGVYNLAAPAHTTATKPKHGGKDRYGAVASLSGACSRLGIDVLERGGNAADAAITTQVCLGVVAPHVTGLGGGGFAVVRSSNGTYESIDFREAAPAAAFEDMYKDNVAASLIGGLASGVPGELRGLEYIHEHYASLPWADLVYPSVKLARDGFKIQAGLANNIIKTDTGFFVDDPAWSQDFAPNGTRLGVGDIITRKRYAEVLEVIAENGPDAFYTGSIARTTVQALKKTNGTMIVKDLEDYRVIIRDSLSTAYRGYKLTTCGAPSSGTVTLQILKIIERYNDIGESSTVDLGTHRLDEAIRFGYGARTKLGDPAFVEDLLEYQAAMLDATTIDKIIAKISDDHTLPVAAYNPDGLESIETPGTSHLVTADASGLAITLTSTVNTAFGSKVIVPETGIVMNNEMNDFSIPNSSNAFGYIPSPANYVAPGKRPQSSITPIIVEFLNNSTLYFVVGAAGGSQIITSTLQSIFHVLDQHATAPEALAAPRFHDQLVPNQISFEYTYNNETTASMKQRQHNITWFAGGRAGSDVQAIRRMPNGTFEAASEPRILASGGYAV